MTEAQTQQIEGYPLSPQQSRVWQAQEASGGAVFRTKFVIRMEGALDLARLREALRRVIVRHDILRATFRYVPGLTQPLQVIAPAGAESVIEVEDFDLRRLRQEGADDFVERLFHEDKDQEPTRSPFKASLLILDERRCALFISLTALCADAHTAKILTEEISRAYASSENDDQAEEERLQYAQFAQWQNENADSVDVAAARDFWRQQQIFPAPSLTLPFANSVAYARTFRPRSLALAIDRETALALELVAQEAGADLAAVLLAGWQVLLWRLSGQSPLIVGSMTDGRKYAELEAMPGPISQYLPIRARLEAGLPFAALVEEVYGAMCEAYEWQEGFRFGPGAVTESALLPYFHHCFDYQDIDERSQADGVVFSLDRLRSLADRFDLRLFCQRVGDSLVATLDFNPAVYAEDQIRRLAENFRALLQNVASDSQVAVDRLNLLTAETRRELLVSFNDTRTGIAALPPAHQLFEAQAAETPNRIAVECSAKRITYAELNARADRLAFRLRRLGVGPEVVVALLCDHSVELLVALLGALKAGGAYLPLDPSSPPQRLAFMLDDAGASLVLTRESLRDRLPSVEAEVICLDEIGATADEDAVEPGLSAPPVSPENLAYMIYTSGSSGEPKGVMVTHRGLSNYLRWSVEAYRMKEGVGAPLHSSVAFDLSVTSLFGPLLSGGRVVMASGEAGGVESLAEALRGGERFSLVKVTPSHARLLGEQMKGEGVAVGALVVGGEALRGGDVEAWREMAPEAELVNEYGPTEAVVGCCVYRRKLGELSVGGEEAIPIGRPIANARLYVLDGEMEPAPVGMAGELYIGGVGVGRGYMNRAGLTAERFVPDPFAGEEGARMYRTGDVARHRGDGELEYLGRVDEQVKVRGYRVEPGEIEAALRKHSAIRDSVVVAREDASGARRLIAYSTLRCESAPAVSELRQFLGETLPDYMLPVAFVFVDALPLTPNGKVDRRALPEPDQAMRRAGASFTPPRTVEEEILAGIWSRVLGVGQVGIDDNYFALGGDSIRSLQVVAQSQSQGLRFTIAALFKHQTIRELARALREFEIEAATPVKTAPFDLLAEEDRLRLADGRFAEIEDAYPLSKLQAGMVYHREYHPESAIYHDICAFHVKAPFDAGLIREAIGRVVARHPALRTSFNLTDFTEPLQLVHRAVATPLEVEDLSHLDAAGQNEAIAAWLAAEKRRGFDYERPPLLRFHIHIRSAEAFQFTLSFHHAIIDGWSDATMITELARSYFLSLRGETLNLDPPATFYRDFIALERQALQNEDSRRFWIERLEGGEALTIPRWRSHAELAAELKAEDRGVSRLDIPVPKEVSDGLKRLALQAAVPVKSALLSVHLRVLSLISGQPDVTTFLTAVGRPETGDGDRILGLFLNSTPFRMKFAGGTWAELAQAAFAAERDALPHRRFPMAELQKLRGGERLSETGFYFTHYYIYQDLDEFPEFDLVSYNIYEETSITLLANFSLDAFTSNLKFHLTCDRTQIGEEQLKAIGGYYDRALRAMAADPAGRYDELCLLSADERRRLLIDLNDTAARPEPLAVHQLIARQAERTPDAAAVECDGVSLNCEELNRRANQLAHYLRGLGVKPETLVAVCAERSIELIISILGALKAGGAYLPLDPKYPRESLAFILADAAPLALLTQAHLSERLPERQANVIRLDAEWEAISRQPDSDPATAVLPDNPAYAIYTSGSTGRPKGTLITHGGLSNYLDHCLKTYPLQAGRRAPAHSSVAFDLTVTSLLAPLAAGQCVLLIPDAAGVEGLSDALRERGDIGLVKLTPSHARLLRERLRERLRDTGPAAPPQALIIGGEALTAEDVAYWRERAPDTLLFNEYGPTETTVGCCVHRFNDSQPASGAVPIGRPIINTQLYVLDTNLQPAPPMTPGTLYIGGAGLARGYLNRPDLTAERFIPDPFSGRPGARLYGAGDLARHLPDGALEFLGRIDDQVKIRGYRIEPGEIESALAQHPLVQTAVVAARAAAHGDGDSLRLVAYVVVAPEARANGLADELRRFLAEKLPEYMIPAAFVALDEAPLTANGKVDRRALPDFARHEAGAAFAGPRLAEEEILCGVWAKALGVERVGIDDDYFALGGDSIRSIRVVSLAREKGLVFTLGDLFKHRTVRQLAQALKEAEARAADLPQTAPLSLITGEDRAMLPAGIEDAYPISKLQAGMIYHREMRPDAAIYHDVFSFHLKAPLDQEKLREAIERLTARHPALRTTFDLTSYSEPLQLVHCEGATPLGLEDVSHLPPAEQEATIEEWIAAEKRRGFDHTRLPLIRFHVHRRGAETFQFTLSFHHAIIDGWSDATMLTELALEYLLLNRGEQSSFTSPQTRYSDFVALEQEALRSEEIRRYWLDKLEGSVHVVLPREPGAATEQSRRGAFRHAVEIPDEVSDGLQRLARLAAAPIKSVLLAAHLRVMNLIAGRDDVLTCVTANGRPETGDGERALGLFLNSMPFRTKLSGGAWTDLAQEAFEQERQSLPFRRYPLAELQRIRGGERISETAFYFTHYHIYNNLRRFADLEILGLKPYEETSFTMVAMFGVHPFTSRVTLQLNCDQTQISTAQAARLAGYYAETLAAMAADPSGRYEAFDPLSTEERRRLLVEWNGARSGAQTDQCLHEMFEAQAARRPDAEAVACEGERLSYDQLNRRANRLAHRLQSLGVGPESLVGLCLERSVEMVVGALAVLKAGGAYVPLDPQYPQERLAFMLEDSGARVLVTERRLAERLPRQVGQVIYLDDQEEGLSRESEENPNCVVMTDNAAYVIYTSGSTGQPKGVMVSHANVCRLMKRTEQWFGFGERDVWTLFHSFAFDFSVWEMWGALAYGGRLVIAPYLVSRAPEAFHELLRREEVTVLNQTPSAFRQLMEADDVAGGEGELALRLVIFGGEALDYGSLREWIERRGDHQPRLVNMYGITETTVHVTYRSISEADVEEGRGSLIGGPIPDLRVYVVDEQMRLALVGVAGELYVGGAGLARGYLNRPGLTAERFVPDPFSGEAGARLYRSGDRARRLPSGELEYLGRADDQVKVRGFRIELGEIEATLRAHPAVREAVVIAQVSGANEAVNGRDTPRLVAYVALDRQIPASELRAFALERLPDYMAPAAFVTLGEMPLTPSGKTDRRALQALDAKPSDLTRPFIAPRTPTEKTIAEIWERTLGVERVSANDNFFELGGHSLLATQIISRLRERFQTPLPLRDLLTSPTVAGLAEHVENARWARQTPPIRTAAEGVEEIEL